MDGNSFWVEEVKDQLPVSLKRKRNVRIKKLEFVGWGSKPLIEFLQSIGKDTSRSYSQQEVTAIVTEYVNSNGLLNPQKKKRVMCDARLHSLFGKKVIPRLKIYDLLEVHFSENHNESEDESSDSSKEEDVLIASKGRKSTGSPKKKVPVVPKSCFAAVIAENIKLVYLKRSLVQDLLKTPESFEDKIVGSFVRVKSDPNDYFQKNSHQLQQVEGVKTVMAASDAAFEIHLRLSNLMKDIPISSLSDDNFYEEECEDLRERIKAGLLKRPTVLELESKAQVLHKDITKHETGSHLVKDVNSTQCVAGGNIKLGAVAVGKNVGEILIGFLGGGLEDFGWLRRKGVCWHIISGRGKESIECYALIATKPTSRADSGIGRMP
ncbi:hypothetical protein R3W88_001980 [Solanum pinnatisectum]|uniref:SWIB complex BAF60b domain-containing protein n=1 Tax=Solanum pinnatisectum TaxID=50273 RepID=A0AAV9ML23_9SOLN|nr:hypothetical protein R3W88_001980 [Solanum pinnatisectum]